jgi:probable HAF family extracellular repeat protein
MKKSASKFALLVFVCLSMSVLADTIYSFQTIIFPGDNFTQLLGINNFSRIAGYHGSGATGHPNQGFTLFLPDHFISENFPGSAQTQVIGVNNRGNTDGFYIDAAGVTHGFTDIHGVFATVDFPNPDSVLTQLLGLNDKDEAAGYWQNAAGTQFPFTVRGGVFTGLDKMLPSNTSAQATGVNNAGDVSGFYVDSGGINHGFLLHHGVVTILDFPGATLTQAFGLNNQRQVVGAYMDAAGNTHGFLYDVTALEFQSVNDPKGVDSTTINGINDVGEIVGFFVDPITGNTNGLVGRIARCVE